MLILRKTLSILPCLAALLVFASPQRLNAQEYFGSFQGDLIVKALDGGRNLKLTHPFSFVDPAGKHWPVPVGTVIDGASIPQAFWSIIGGPFEDKYREASVIHDYYCEEKTEGWESVHLVFYNGMRARGVGSIQAKLMYAAVYAFGPRWIETVPGETNKLISGQPILLENARKEIVRFISDNDPSITAIEQVSDDLAKTETIEQLEKLLYENANCTPILSSDNAAISPRQTLVLCGLSSASKKQAAIKNLRALVTQLRELLQTQMSYLLPLINEYVNSQDPKKWDEVKEWSRNVHGLIKLGMRSALDVEGPDTQGIRPLIDDVFDVLSGRAVLISAILTGPPKSESEMREWAVQYRALVRRLETKVSGLEQHLSSISQ